MQKSKAVPIRHAPANDDWTQGLDDAAVRRIKDAARENIDLLRNGVGQCVHIAVEASEEVAATMIDYAIQLNGQAKEAIRRYGSAAERWERLR
ncbi:hypothetical protein [Sphingomonas sp. BAUL-RG-20F-R05-02]|uniref:hypothetical protein n=1 Tax=Sphingomonas sp. BAUL-RG-20F-R05-02 TaxID=2914830 RepID=UPI001F57DA4C|nr:hypothetical protein [Sphingomonas sp. BAUL-RG-20F-R05-02]